MEKIKYSNQTKLYLRVICLILLIVTTSLASIQAATSKSQSLQEGISNEIIRFHVIANSDSNTDQDLKHKVKDALVKELSPLLKSASSKNEARKIIYENQLHMKEVATAIVRENGYSYPISISLGSVFFPIKKYGDYTFPAGTYEALRVKIGNASGQNWWCVMFPPLCFVDETYSIVTEDSKKQLKQLLTEDEYDTIKDQKIEIKVKLKLLEKIKNLFR